MLGRDEIIARGYETLWREALESDEIGCKSCGAQELYWAPSLERWICRHCSARTGLRCGSFMENSNLPIWVWLHVAYSIIEKGEQEFDPAYVYREIGQVRLKQLQKATLRIKAALKKPRQRRLLYYVYEQIQWR